MKRCAAVTAAVATLLLVAGWTSTAGQSWLDADVERLLRAELRFSAGDMRDLQAGRTAIYTSDTPEPEQLEHVSAVLLDVTPREFIERFSDIERFERGPGTPQIGRFGTRPQLADLSSLTLPAEDIEALRTCRPGDCDVKFPAGIMARFRDEVDWHAPDQSQQANRLARAVFLDLVLAYQAEGNEALGTYSDGNEPLPVAEHLEGLIALEEGFPVEVPGLLRFLREYPAGRPTGVEDFFYWTVVNFGLKDTVRINHVTVYPLPRSSSVTHVIAIKQLYASHYFHTTLELRFLLRNMPPDAPQQTVFTSITRSRNDGMTGLRGWFLRPLITRRSRAGVRGYLEHMAEQVERPVEP